MNGASRSVLPARGHLDAPSYSSSTANVFECLPEMIRRSQTEPLERSAAFWSKASSCKKVSSWSRTSEPMRSHNKGLGPLTHQGALQSMPHHAAPCRTMPHHKMIQLYTVVHTACSLQEALHSPQCASWLSGAERARTALPFAWSPSCQGFLNLFESELWGIITCQHTR